MAKVFTEGNSENLNNLLEFIKESVLKPKGFKRYLKPYSEFLGKNIEFSDFLPLDSGFSLLDKLASDYKAALLKGDTNVAESIFDEYMQLSFELEDAEKKLNPKEKIEENPKEKSVEVSSTLKDLYDAWADDVKSDVGMNLKQLQSEYNDSKRLSLDLTEAQYMEGKWNDTCF